ncbi:hypothetical protein M2161_000581 [Streptomyces sp. SAI-133]|nr:hypothetical protein [Streptomyces sp. SAI-133]MDH6581475.1 hypothetical protein [Streptomyces sp. SAI-133]
MTSHPAGNTAAIDRSIAANASTSLPSKAESVRTSTRAIRVVS